MPRSPWFPPVRGLAAALLLGFSPVALAAAPAAAGPAPPEHPTADVDIPYRTTVRARGDVTTTLDFSTRAAREVAGGRCELVVDAVLSFTGTLAGNAVGTTTALVFAPCAEATSTPPGTFFDTFHFAGTFAGRVGGVVTLGDLDYIGLTSPGGKISATVLLNTPPADGLLRADGEVGGLGSYRGVARIR